VLAELNAMLTLKWARVARLYIRASRARKSVHCRYNFTHWNSVTDLWATHKLSW